MDSLLNENAEGELGVAGGGGGDDGGGFNRVMVDKRGSYLDSKNINKRKTKSVRLAQIWKQALNVRSGVL